MLRKLFPKENPQGASSPKGKGQRLKGQDAHPKGSAGRSTELKSGTRKVAVFAPATGGRETPEEFPKEVVAAGKSLPSTKV